MGKPKTLIREGAFGKVYSEKDKAIKLTEFDVSDSSAHLFRMQLRNDIFVTEIVDWLVRRGGPQCFSTVINWNVQTSNGKYVARFKSPLYKMDGLRLLRSLDLKAAKEAYVAMSAAVLGAQQVLYQIGITHRDLKANNVLVTVLPDGARPTRVQVWDNTVTLPPSTSKYDFKLIDFGSAGSLGDMGWFSERPLKPYESTLRPKIEFTDKSRRPKEFVYFDTPKKQRKVASVLRFGGLLPVLADAMQWFGAGLALVGPQVVGDFGCRALALVQWTEQRLFTLTKNEKCPDVVEPPRVAGRRFTVPATLRRAIVPMYERNPCPAMGELEGAILSLALRHVLPLSAEQPEMSYTLSPQLASEAKTAVRQFYLIRPGAYSWCVRLTKLAL